MVQRLIAEKKELVTQVSAHLKARYAEFAKSLEGLIDQNEVLSYEIYSGAGEHIRYQMAGGETESKEARNLASEKSKDNYEWKFKDEVWEDEIGHFRSSLKNVCPKDDPEEEAKISEKQENENPEPESN